MIADTNLYFFFNVELQELLHILKINPVLLTSFADTFFFFLLALFIVGEDCIPGVSFYV